MLRIYIPASFVPEREYAIKCIFSIILGIKYEISIYDERHYRIILPNYREIVIEDHFFSAYNEKDGYLSSINIPVKTSLINNNEFAETSIPLIFGRNLIALNNDNTLLIGCDLFASSFFMLTRWEEFVSDARDEHGRYPGSSSLAFRHNFLNRPLVNEYSEILWKIITKLGYEGNRVKRDFKILPSHDIDQLKYWTDLKKKSVVKNLIGDVLLRRRFDLALKRVKSYLLFYFWKRDPFETFNYLIDKADSIGCKATFYFIAGGETVYENNYSVRTPEMSDIFKKISLHGHIIGIHPSYNAYNNDKLLSEEISVLSEITGSQISEGRNHYLRFEVPASWNILQKAGIRMDSSLYYSDLPGFRCGICQEFPVFDILKREIMNLYESPLVVMDTSYKNKKPETVYKEITDLKNTVKKYNGNFVFLWHNSNIDAPEWKKYKKSFEEAFYG